MTGPQRARGGDITMVPSSMRASQRMFVRGPLLEKVALVSMVTIVFAQILPGVRATTTQIVLAVLVVVVLNSVVSHWVAGRGAQWTSTAGQFVAVSAINAGIVLGLVLLPTPGGASIDAVPALFFLLLLSLLVTLYDRYRMLRILRRDRPDSGRAARRGPSASPLRRAADENTSVSKAIRRRTPLPSGVLNNQ